MAPIRSGARAPPIEIPDHTGAQFDLRAAQGSWIVVYFYPRDSTPGCTLEAKEFSDLLPDFAARNVRVYGISDDSPGSHEEFRTACDLRVPLLADEQHTAITAYGVGTTIMHYGRWIESVVRTTFLIDPHGVIAHVWERVTPEGHARAVLNEVDARLSSAHRTGA